MSRKLSNVDFARVWGWVSRLSKKHWGELVELRRIQDEEMIVPAATVRARQSRKPKDKPEGGAG